ncbi:MAG: hypothetical protein BGO12_07030 [Verrucomicrobia bacterium 61-8]|nr:PAS domain-containing protein [Verrucomicrobiota bacterium]OJV20465.1 MAG: hypothetical protein BGO12_07030 [Verrucomicrobia bacterium 61-8]
MSDLPIKGSDPELTVARLHRMTSVLPGIMYECEIYPDGRSQLTFMSDAVRDIFGLNPEDLLRDSTYFHRFVHPDDRESLISASQEHVRTLQPWHREYRYIFPKIGMRWVESQGHLSRRESDGTVIWNGFITDITERKLQQEALLESESRFQALLSSPSVGFVITPVDFSWKTANAAMARLLGYTVEEFHARCYADITTPADLPTLKKTLEEIVTGQRAYFEGEFRYVRKDGSLIWTLSCISVARDLQGQPKYLVIQATDLSELKRTERELREAKEEADRANLAKSQFLTTMSHEIRTPLHGVIGFTSLLQKTELSAEQKEIVESIDQSSKLLLSLVSDVLDLSRIEAGRLTLDLRDIDLRALVLDIGRSTELDARRRGLAFSCTIADDVPDWVESDSLRIHQILGNLLGNALKFTNEGSVTLDVRSRSSPDGSSEIHFTVRDTGIGIARTDHAKIFHPFSQADSSLTRKFGGTGLGLAIVRNLCELLGGGIRFESAAGQGTTFHATIKVRPPAMAHEPTPAASETSDAMPRGLRVLVAEDNLLNQKLIRRMLERLNCDTTIVSTGQECVEISAVRAFDLIFMDVSMPGMDGLQATRMIREGEARKESPHIPIVAITAGVSETERADCISAGMTFVLGKPFTGESLRAAILAALS